MSGTWAVKKYLIKAVKVVGWICLTLIAALLLFIACIQIPYVQNKLVQKAVAFLENKIGTDVTLRRISISFPKKVVLEGIYFEDQKNDTLFSAGTLSIDTDLWALLERRIQLNAVSLDDWRAFISRQPTDSAFNFEYIIDAFADSTAVPDSTQTPWKFSFEELEFTRARITFQDLLDGNEADVRFKTLAVAAKEVDLENRRLKLKSIDLENSSVSVFQAKPLRRASTEEPVAGSESTPFEIDLHEIHLTDVRSVFKNVESEQVMHLDVGKFVLLANKIDLNRKIIDLEKISSSKTFISFQQTGHRSKAIQPIEQDSAKSTWSVSLTTLELLDNNFQYYDFSSPAGSAIDFDHLWLTQLNLDARDLKYDSNTVEGNLKNLSLRERSGFSISSLTTKFSLTDKTLDVQNFLFRSPLSMISLEATARFSSLAQLTEHYPDAEVRLALKPSYLSIQDMLYFSPGLLENIPLTVPRNARVNMESFITGKVNDLTINHINVDAFSDTRLRANGRIRGLPDKQAMIDFTLNELYTSRADIQTFSPDTLIPKNINIPKEIFIKGKYHGTISTPHISADLSSDEGSIGLNANLNLSRPGKERYSGKLSIKGLKIGNILDRKSMGTLELEASAEGSGLTMKNLNTKIDLRVLVFEYNGYRYENFTLNGSLKNYFFSGNAALPDKNLNFNFRGDLDYSEDIALYKFDFNLKNADLKALGLSKRPLKIRGKIDVDVATADFKSINGTVDIREVAVYNDKALYAVDSLLFASIDQKGNSKISIRSDILAGDFVGTINLFDMPNALRNHFNNYFILRDSIKERPSDVQQFSFDLQLKNTDLLTEVILPDLEPFVPGKVSGMFDSESKILNLHLDLSRLQYATVSADSILLDVSSDKSSIDYVFRLSKLRMDTLRIETVSLTGNVANDSLYSKFTILDSLQKDKYVLGGVFNRNDKAIKFRLLADRVIINYAPWETPGDNFLQFSNTGIEAYNFSITNINEKLSLVTERGANTTTSIVFKDLNLRNLTNLVEGTIVGDGLMNGNFTISAKGAFNSLLKIDGLDLFNTPWGDLKLIAGRTSNGPYTADLSIKGQYADLRVLGEYQLDSASSQIDLKTTVSSLNLKMIEPFAAGQLKNLDGHVNGELSIKGKLMAPAILGNLEFRNATFTPVLLNSPFSIDNEAISFISEGIQLRNFDIRDKNNNAATLNGTILTSNYNEFDLNLQLRASNFQLLNTTEDDNELFYGNVNINTTATISGSLIQPRIQMQVSLNEESELTYVVPQSEKGVTEQKGIVLFVDRDSKDDPFLASINPRDTAKSTFRGLDLTANIELSDDETFSIIIDPITGDKLSVKGNSTLTLDIDPTGDVQLSGRYELTEGTYDLTFYKLVKRKFLINKGSTITWTGEPLLATMDIRAYFEVETSPLELVGNQIPPSNQQERNMYRQRLPFLVYLNIKGDLLTPEINFELDMPIDHRNAMAGSIYATIKDINTRESDLNKQVFALLILRRFISDNPFDTQGGSDVEETARRSVSKLLTEQLNRLSENIKGIELSFDVKSYEDYSTGQAQGQTEVQLGVSKSLLDDRLVVKVSGNVDIEGNTANQNSLTDYIGDLALEYKLTEDGRFRITGFRNNSYDIISGELIETGAGLIYIKDYTALRELFKANAKEK